MRTEANHRKDNVSKRLDSRQPDEARAQKRAFVVKVLAVLRRHSSSWNAPVVSLMAAQEKDPFLVLIGCILSLRTKDEITAQASRRLFARARNPRQMLALDVAEIEQLIYPVGFYRTKARTIRQICEELVERFAGRVPQTLDELMSLPGVGRKTANLVLSEAFDKAAICVDVHVHRISNRWGLVATRTPEQTEAALRNVLPRSYWAEYNGLLVAFGQTICRPISPWCSCCPIESLCPKYGVGSHR